ncbi:RHS repeat-associated core domain-containing protein [Paenibacillus campi]|uniref:RHS repeat domain-containing protein n=1 Tax=Paenibacillus campi TaxID=3106031 RepID=UPI002AFDFB40|nr:RHS repeat-associated core domain-containing protein [Paenibacillus sp. SGZ-1009]
MPLCTDTQVSRYRSNPDNTSIRLNLLEQYFDAYGHKTKVIAYKDGASGHSQPIQESYTYDLVGNVLSYTDPNGTQNSQGVTTAYTYDALNRLTAVQDALNQTSRYTYDGGGGLTSVMLSNPSGKSETLYTKNYNEQGLPTDKIDPTNNRTQMNYTARGLTEKIVDRNGTTTTYTYDERGERTSASLKADGSNALITGTLQTKSVYGADGNVLTDRHELSINAAKVATQTSTSDTWDRITSLASSATDYSARLDANYDPLDRVTRQTNTLNGTRLSINYGYEKSRLTSIQTNGAADRTSAATANVRYAYTPLGQVQQITFPTLSDGSTLQESMTYDLLNRLTRVRNMKGDAVLSAYNYQYDNNGNIISVTEQMKDGNSQTSTYTYDKLNRLHSVQRADGTETEYSYDLRGNRLTQQDTRDLPADKATNYRYDLDDRLIRVGTNTTSTTMQYLPDGLRYQKTQGNAITRYGYDHWNRITSTQQTDGTTSQYVRGDRVLMKKDLTHSKDYDYLYNGHGDVVQIVGTDGTVLNSYQYDEWGNLTQQKEAITNEFKYAGELYDAETGLYYLKARYYDPKQGRFLNEDSDEGQIDNPLSMNVYTYGHNNPLRYTDPSGHSVESEPSEEKTAEGSYSGGAKGGTGQGGGNGSSGARSSTSSNESTKTQKQEVEKSNVVAESDSATNASKLQEEQLEIKKFKEGTGETGWSMPKGGGTIGGRRYSEHSLERMAPNTPEVRAELTTRANQRAAEQGLRPGTKEYNDFINKQVDPRGITPSVVEDTIKNGTKTPGNTQGTSVYQSDRVRVVTNANGDVITVIPR